METTCKELCVREQSQTWLYQQEEHADVCKLPSVLHGCIAADSSSQGFCGYQHAGPEVQATLSGEQIWLLPNMLLSDTLCSLKACFISA